MNLDVTAPGATLALGLMYLKTNDAAIARVFSIPDTHFALDYVKPDLIVLQVLARGLVMWDEVAATKEWVESQLPDIMKVDLLTSFGCGHIDQSWPLNRCSSSIAATELGLNLQRKLLLGSFKSDMYQIGGSHQGWMPTKPIMSVKMETGSSRARISTSLVEAKPWQHAEGCCPHLQAPFSGTCMSSIRPHAFVCRGSNPNMLACCRVR